MIRTACQRNRQLSESPSRIVSMRRASLVARGWMLVFAWAIPSMSAMVAADEPQVFVDPRGDIRILKTDDGANGLLDPANQQLPDLLEIRVGAFEPTAPSVDPYAGVWNDWGDFVRVDLVLDGLVNPPGTLGWVGFYDPLKYGPNPVYGYAELDMDADEDTGGELEYTTYRYAGVVGRFGGLPVDPRFAGRIAVDFQAFDGDIETGPFVEKSGEEFHIALVGEEIDQVNVLVEAPGGNPAIFESGEVWDVCGDLFHRAHGFEDFAFMCFSDPGKYEPVVCLRFAHETTADTTTISLVYPLTNEGSAEMAGPGKLVERNNGCDSDQNSVQEALVDLQFSAENADPLDRLFPEFDLIEGWEFKIPADHLDPAAWRVSACLSTGYAGSEPGGAKFVWTDVLPNVTTGDFDGNGQLDGADQSALSAYILAHDGNANFDDDGDRMNGSIEIHNFASSFILFDTDYDGFVDATDSVIKGDMDLNLLVDFDDVDDFVLALTDPDSYASSHGGVDPVARGDMNGDWLIDGADIAGFADTILAAP